MPIKNKQIEESRSAPSGRSGTTENRPKECRSANYSSTSATLHSCIGRPTVVKSLRGPGCKVPSSRKICIVLPPTCATEKCRPSTSPTRNFPSCTKRSPKEMPKGTSRIGRCHKPKSRRGPGCKVPSERKIWIVWPPLWEMEKWLSSTAPIRKLPNCMKRSPKCTFPCEPVILGSQLQLLKSLRGPGWRVPSKR